MEEITFVPRQFSLEEWNEREYELAEKAEELEAQKEELSAAIEELNSKNEYLSRTLEELSQRKNELDQLIYRMSHDLRTPVTSILGVCHVMKLEGLPTSFYFHLDHIQKKGYELDTLLNSLSSFSLVAFEPISTEKIFVRKLLADVLDSLKTVKGFTEVNFSFQYQGEEYFLCDKARLFLLIRNIVKNTVDFRSAERAAVTEIVIRVNAEQAVFEIRDNGTGIDPAVQPRIFEMFYRGSDRSVGSGLGLYIARQIIHTLMGSITVHSVPGDTSLTIVIPLKQID